MLYLKSFTFNPFEENTYVVYTDNKEAWIIDPGNYTADEHQALKKFIDEQGLKPGRLLLTHGHLDHVFGCKFVHDNYGLLPEIHRNDLFFLEKMEQSASMYGLDCEKSHEPVSFLEEGIEIRLGTYKFTCILAPGHSPGSICFYNEANKLLIGGDVLFNGSVGRGDLPGGNFDELIGSIRTKLLTLDDDVKVYSGHGSATTIGNERRNNPFLT